MKLRLVISSVLTASILAIAAVSAAAPQGGLTLTGGIIESDVDTMRILNTTAIAGDTIFIDVFLHNVDTLGAYAYRIAYDPAVLTPLEVFVPGQGNLVTTYQLRGIAFEQFAGAIASPGIVTFLAADFDLDSSTAFLPGSGAAARMAWSVNLMAPTQTTIIAFANHPDFPNTWNAWTDFWGTILKRPVMQDGTVSITERACYCPYRTDFDSNGSLDSGDLATEIDVVFFGSPDIQDPKCPNLRADFNADGFPDSVDLSELINHVFFGGSAPVDPCAP